MADTIINIAKDEDKETVKNAYAQIILDLQAIQTKTSWTNAEAVNAIKTLAGISEAVQCLIIKG